jgi:hypothetical protein
MQKSMFIGKFNELIVKGIWENNGTEYQLFRDVKKTYDSRR